MQKGSLKKISIKLLIMRLSKIIEELKKVNQYQITNLYSLETIFKILSIYVTPIFVYLRCSANITTLIALIVGLSASAFHIIFGYQIYHICFLLFFLSVIIDYCDGNIARLTNTPSFFGRFIDGLFDIIVIGFFQISLLYSVINHSEVYTDDLLVLINFDFTLILMMVSLFFTPIQHLIYDRYSAYIRWLNFEHDTKLYPTLRNEISFKPINLLDNIGFICLVLGTISINFFIIYFIINLFLSIYLIMIHILFSKKYMSVFADDHRKPDK